MGKSLMNKKNISKKKITGIILIVTLVFLVGYAFVQYTAEPDLRKKDGKENRMPFDGDILSNHKGRTDSKLKR